MSPCWGKKATWWQNLLNQAMNGDALVKGLEQYPSQKIVNQYILSIIRTLNFFHQMCVKCYLIIALCSLIINDAEHLFILLPVCIASSVLCPFISFVHFSPGAFTSFYWFEELFILSTNYLQAVWTVSSQSLWFTFPLSLKYLLIKFVIIFCG